ncbi:MAG: protein NosL [Sterolibacteriaceae bacterium]|uniref:protein NosL n=1 Tax=Sulfuritalea sp. TaxID=2480090 RepID=UPI001A493342|nr:protein NosL [Sulfuritalea sp.]MBL8478946.1 protein NosL [Sterolibacteriaceae bacterium]MBN8476838.1 protein NosL [Sulfuritalea sp.]
MHRRRFLAAATTRALALTPIAAALSACGGKGEWPEGMAEIKWDRDTCVRCSMAISDRRFAAEMRGGEKNIVFKFDDIGCAVFWMRDKARDFPWMAEPATRLWVADATGKGDKWLDARKAHYSGGAMSPMGYNQSARAYAEAGSFDFREMSAHVLAKGK